MHPAGGVCLCSDLNPSCLPALAFPAGGATRNTESILVFPPWPESPKNKQSSGAGVAFLTSSSSPGEKRELGNSELILTHSVLIFKK